MKRVIIFLLLLSAGAILSTVSAQEKDTLKTEDVLNMSFEDLMGVSVVTASKTQQSIKDVAASVHVITADQIRDRGYFTLEEALSDLPGFQFRNIIGFNSYVFLRGAPNQNNLILLMVDGVQINELNSGGFYAGGQFILSDVEQIEVVYGPASALYGTNAVSGIINIITKNLDGKSGQVSLLGGNFRTGMLDLNLRNYNASKDIGYSFSGQYKTTGKADLAGVKGDNNWTDDMENFENDLSFSGRLKVKSFDAGINYMEKRSSTTTNTKSVNDIYLDRNTLWNIMFLNAFIKCRISSHKKWSLNSTGYYRNSTVMPNTIYAIIKATETTSGKQIGYYRPNQLFGLENQFNFKPSDRLLILAGVIGEVEMLSNGYSISNSISQDIAPPAPPKPPILNNYLVSYYAQFTYTLFKQLNIVGGIRHDFSSYYGQVLVPRIGLVFNENRFTAKVLYNRAFRSPKPWDYNYGTGNSSLKPEKMKSFELCLSYQLNKDLSFGGSLYLNTINDKLTKETGPTVDRWINKDILSTTGFELYGDYCVGNFDIYANYTYNDSHDQADMFIPEISMNTANAGCTYLFRQLFKINLRANYLGNRKNPGVIPATGNDKIGAALIFNGCVSFIGLKNCNLQLKMNNILNQEYYHPSNRFSGRYRQPQRNFTLNVVYSFGAKNK
jgi:outer membrane receptor for ferrienterochelin and colicins